MQFIFTDPAKDFSNGLHVITVYHQDFLEKGSQLLKLAHTIKNLGINETLANQCVDMYCHYSHANHLHHKDEEQALFPLLVDQSNVVIGMIERLMLDHEEIETSWDLLADLLNKPEKISDVDKFLQLTIDFEKIQRDHLNREDEDFIPRLEGILSDQQLKQAGDTMSKLRHLTK